MQDVNSSNDRSKDRRGKATTRGGASSPGEKKTGGDIIHGR